MGSRYHDRMMIVNALTVCVQYSDLLERGIENWLRGLQSLVVVTDLTDTRTAELAARWGCQVHETGVFYEDGAYFCKGAALQEARALLPPSDWHLFLDADVIPPGDWLARIEAQAPQIGMLHGARRLREDGTPIADRELAGFFQLFHSSDSRAQAPLQANFIHAGNYDSEFMFRWPRQLQRILPLDLIHLGEPGVNWCGKGNEAAMAEIRDARRRGRNWRREVISK